MGRKVSSAKEGASDRAAARYKAQYGRKKAVAAKRAGRTPSR